MWLWEVMKLIVINPMCTTVMVHMTDLEINTDTQMLNIACYIMYIDNFDNSLQLHIIFIYNTKFLAE